MRFGLFLVVTIACGALFGWVVPDLAESGPAEVDGAEPPQENRLAVVQRERRRGGEVVLPRADGGHFYAEVSIESGSALMLVDTGATVVALTGDDASMMGVEWNDSEVRPVARGAGGDVYGVPVVLDSVRVGDLEARGVQAVVIPEDLDVSLLGQSFLSKMKRVEMNGDEMVLAD